MNRIRTGSAALLVTVVACALCTAASQARDPDVRVSAPASLVAGKPCRLAVAVSDGLGGMVVLQRRAGGAWLTVSMSRLSHGSAKLRCGTAKLAGRTPHFRALVRRGGLVVARSRTVAIRIVSAPPVVPIVVPPAPPVILPPSPPPVLPNPPPPLPPSVNPAQFGMEGTGGPPSAAALALLASPNVILDAGGIADLNAGRIDPRIVAVLALLSQAHTITVSALCSDHAKLTAGGSVSNHWYGRGVDIAAINGVPVSVSNVTAHRIAIGLSLLPASYRPDEIGAPWPIPGPGYFSDAYSRDKLHVAFTQLIDAFWVP